jgi:hypothetical protein
VDRRTAAFFVLALGVLGAVAVAAAVLGSGQPQTGRPDGAPTVDGIVVGVDSAGLGDVRSFRLRTTDGRTLTFDLSGLRDGPQFPPGHLTEHLATSLPVRVWYEGSGDSLKALWLEDKPGDSPAPTT